MQLFQDNKNQIVFSHFLSHGNTMRIFIFASAFLLQVAKGQDQGTPGPRILLLVVLRQSHFSEID